jgi:hypothetical protein
MNLETEGTVQTNRLQCSLLENIFWNDFCTVFLDRSGNVSQFIFQICLVILFWNVLRGIKLVEPHYSITRRVYQMSLIDDYPWVKFSIKTLNLMKVLQIDGSSLSRKLLDDNMDQKA